MIKRIILPMLMLCGVLFGVPHWQPVIYSNSTAFYGYLTINGQTAEAADMVGAFVGNECRGVTNVTVRNDMAYVVMLIQGEASEQVQFRTWDASFDDVYDILPQVMSSPGNTIGTYPGNLYHLAATYDNHLPQLTIENAEFIFNEDQNLSFDFTPYVSDPDDDPLSISFSGNNHVHIAVHSLSEVIFTADTNFNGSENVFAILSDGEDSVSQQITVLVNSVNDAPFAIGSIPDFTLAQGQSSAQIDLRQIFDDYDLPFGDILTFSVTGAGNFNVALTNGTVVLTPRAYWFGSANIIFVATDLNGASASDQVHVTVTNINDSPYFANLAETLYLTEDVTRSFNWISNVKDHDNDIVSNTDQLTLGAQNSAHLTIANLSGVGDFTFSIIPAANFSGQESITFTLSDNHDRIIATREQAFMVNPTNDNPYVAHPTPDIAMGYNETNGTIWLNNVFADRDLIYGDHLTFSASGNNRIGVEIQANGHVVLSSPSGWDGYENITFTATDDSSATASDIVRVTINSTSAGDISQPVQQLRNFPNPFNPATTIYFSLLAPAKVNLTVYDIRGQKVKTLLAGNFSVQEYKIPWNGTDDNRNPVGSGIYFYRLTTDKTTKVGKMILLK